MTCACICFLTCRTPLTELTHSLAFSLTYSTRSTQLLTEHPAQLNSTRRHQRDRNSDSLLSLRLLCSLNPARLGLLARPIALSFTRSLAHKKTSRKSIQTRGSDKTSTEYPNKTLRHDGPVLQQLFALRGLKIALPFRHFKNDIVLNQTDSFARDISQK